MIRNKLIKKMLTILFLGSILYVMNSPVFSLDDPVPYISSIAGSPCEQEVTNSPNDGSWLPTPAVCVAAGTCSNVKIIGGFEFVADTCPNQTVKSRAELQGIYGDWRLIGKTNSKNAYGINIRNYYEYMPCSTGVNVIVDNEFDGGGCYRVPGGGGGDGGGDGGYIPSICDFVTGFDQFGTPCDGGGAGNCDYCQYNWMSDAGCSNPYDRNYCG